MVYVYGVCVCVHEVCVLYVCEVRRVYVLCVWVR